MSQLLKYKGYEGSVEYSLKDQVLYGKVLGIKSLLSYEGQTIAELEEDFRGVIDEYLEMCKAHHQDPEPSYSGTFNVRITPELHHQLAIKAAAQHQSLNATTAQAIRNYVATN